ncbi:MAG: glycosyltransferase family 2 protein [Chloroflexota bacterium]
MREPVAPRLSVLMPTWNAAATVERAIASVLDELDIPLELIVIDDASTDNTADIVAGLTERDPRLELIRLRANGGVSNARNRGLAEARGTWLAFLDADDRLLPGAFAALMAPTADPDVLAVIGQRVQADGERVWMSSGYDNPDVRRPGRKSIASHPGLMSFAAVHGKVFHRSLLDDLTFEGRVLGDQPWTISALLRAGDQIETIDQVVYEWSRPHPDRYVEGITSATRASSARAAEMAIRAAVVFRTVSDEIDARIPEEAKRRIVKQAYFDRLVRSDIGPAVRDSISRRDPDSGRLYDAVGAFLGSVPSLLLAGSGVLADRVFVPPARHWPDVVRSARSSYWSMLEPAVRARVRVAGGGAWSRLAAPAFLFARRLGAPVGTAIASLILTAIATGWRIGRRLGRSRGNG